VKHCHAKCSFPGICSLTEAKGQEQVRARLSEAYEVFDPESPEQAIALALEHRPDAVPLDLMMSKFRGSNCARASRLSLKIASVVAMQWISVLSSLPAADLPSFLASWRTYAEWKRILIAKRSCS
jgi:CheY-like chemotaxis protein